MNIAETNEQDTPETCFRVLYRPHPNESGTWRFLMAVSCEKDDDAGATITSRDYVYRHRRGLPPLLEMIYKRFADIPVELSAGAISNAPRSVVENPLDQHFA